MMNSAWGWQPGVIWLVDGVPIEGMNRAQLIATFQRTREHPGNIGQHDTRTILSMLYTQLQKRESNGELDRFGISKKIVKAGDRGHHENIRRNQSKLRKFVREERLIKAAVIVPVALFVLTAVAILNWMLPRPGLEVEVGNGVTYRIERE